MIWWILLRLLGFQFSIHLGIKWLNDWFSQNCFLFIWLNNFWTSLFFFKEWRNYFLTLFFGIILGGILWKTVIKLLLKGFSSAWILICLKWCFWNRYWYRCWCRLLPFLKKISKHWINWLIFWIICFLDWFFKYLFIRADLNEIIIIINGGIWNLKFFIAIYYTWLILALALVVFFRIFNFLWNKFFYFILCLSIPIF